MYVATSLASAALAVVVAWPKISPHLPGWFPAFLRSEAGGSQTLDAETAPACMKDPSTPPPQWVADWVKRVSAESADLGPEFVLTNLHQPLYGVAQKARDALVKSKGQQ